MCSGVCVACFGHVRGCRARAACISASPLQRRRGNFACVCDTEESEGLACLRAMGPRWTGCVKHCVQATLGLGYVPSLAACCLSCLVIGSFFCVWWWWARGGVWMVEEGSDVSLNTAAHGGLGHHAAACVPSFILLGTCTSNFQHSTKNTRRAASMRWIYVCVLCFSV